MLDEAQALDNNWGDNGNLRLAAHVAIGGLTGGLGGALGAGAGTLTAPQIDALLADTNLDPSLRKALIALGSTAAGAAAGGGAGNPLTGAAGGFNEVTNNYFTHSSMDKLKKCLSGNTCKTDKEKQAMVKEMEQFSQALDQEVKNICAKIPASDACRNGVNAMTQYAAMADAWYLMNPDVKRSSNQLFDYAYNDPNAKTNFTLYYNTIDNRANFFGASDQYYQNSGVGVKWFGGAYRVSIDDLGASDGSAFLFAIGAGLTGQGSNLYNWRSEAGNALMNDGFNNFKNLYNNGTNNPVAWDINQLRREQTVLQPIHEKYLGGFVDKLFLKVSSRITYIKNRADVDLLDYKSRVTYGCKLLGYGAKQGYKP